MIVLFTDYGRNGPYTGLLKAALMQRVGNVPVIDLLADAPAFNIRASAYLLAAMARQFPAHTVFLAVVDPGVGGERLPVVVEADGLTFVGPHNGLFDIVVSQSGRATVKQIEASGFEISESFHGRDLFAPVAAMIASGQPWPMVGDVSPAIFNTDWPADCLEVIYIDDFGNAFTGMRASTLGRGSELIVSGQEIAYARTFSEMPRGSLFWYGNSSGLVEIAACEGSAASMLNLVVGSGVSIKK